MTMEPSAPDGRAAGDRRPAWPLAASTAEGPGTGPRGARAVPTPESEGDISRDDSMSKTRLMAPRLELVHGGRSARVIQIEANGLVIGRTPGLGLYLDDARVSREHARVECRSDGRCVLVDLGSHNHTYVDDRALAPFRPLDLRDGCRVKIAGIEMIYREAMARIDDGGEDGSTVLGEIDDLSSSYLSTRLAPSAGTIKAILDASRAVGGEGGLDEMLGRVLDSLMAVFPQAERGFLLTAEPDGSLPIRAFRRRCGPDVLPTLSRTIARRVLQEGKGILISDAAADPGYRGHRSVVGTLRSALGVPLSGGDGRPVGMVQLDGTDPRIRFTAADLELLAALTVPAGVAVEKHRLVEARASMAAAREIQRALLPGRRPAIPGYTFWECYHAAHEVGGDLYDYIAAGPTAAGDPASWTVLVGDVAGKGMPAALMMAGICPEIRHLVRGGVPPHEVLARVNREVWEREFDGRFLTLVLAEVDPRRGRLRIACAGHAPPLVRRAGGTVAACGCESSGPPLGVTPDASFQAVDFALEPGDVVVLQSDGVPDAADRQGRRFGEQRLLRILEGAPEGAEATGQTVLSAILAHSAGRSQFDDITLVCFGPNGKTS